MCALLLTSAEKEQAQPGQEERIEVLAVKVWGGKRQSRDRQEGTTADGNSCLRGLSKEGRLKPPLEEDRCTECRPGSACSTSKVEYNPQATAYYSLQGLLQAKIRLCGGFGGGEVADRQAACGMASRFHPLCFIS